MLKILDAHAQLFEFTKGDFDCLHMDNYSLPIPVLHRLCEWFLREDTVSMVPRTRPMDNRDHTKDRCIFLLHQDTRTVDRAYNPNGGRVPTHDLAVREQQGCPTSRLGISNMTPLAMRA